MRLSDGALSLGQGRCWENFEQRQDMNFRLAFLACVRHVLGMCVEWKGGWVVNSGWEVTGRGRTGQGFVRLTIIRRGDNEGCK